MDASTAMDGGSSLEQSVNEKLANDQQPEGGLPSISEIDKFEKFKFQGREWTPKDLERAILRQEDYTKKTQSLSEERKQLEQERKYYENLYVDLQSVKNNPSLAAKFVEVYPEKFHGVLKQILSQSQYEASSSQAPQYTQQQTPDIELISRIANLEKFYQGQEVQKNEAQINAQIEKFSKTYTDAIPELVIGRVYEAFNQGTEVTEELWEHTFKSVDSEMKNLVKQKYGELVKKQTEANNKAKAPEAGGGTVGRAPAKFKNLKDVREFAIKDLEGR